MSEQRAASKDTTAVQVIQLSDLEGDGENGRRLVRDNIDVIRNVKVQLSVSAGKCELTVKDILDLRENSVLTLDKATYDPVDVIIDGNIVARGNLVAVGDQFGVRITDIHNG
jgi:flagellar motor switch protein FliN